MFTRFFSKKLFVYILATPPIFFTINNILNAAMVYIGSSFLSGNQCISFSFLFFGFLVFFNIIFCIFCSSHLGYIGVFLLNAATMILFWLNLFIVYYCSQYNNFYFYFHFGSWFKLNLNLFIPFELFVDSVSLNYTLLTVTIAVSVLIYTFSYFRYEPLVDRLILLISSFVISMVLLVNAGNFCVLFLGWELIGLTSFLLINFWSTRVATLKSAFKAFTFNKFSDLALLVAIILIYNEFETTNINIFRNELQFFLISYYDIWDFKFSIVELISFFVLSSAFVKSAQLGFHLWLPDSMEAPVPASALIHSATLVSAGVFLFLRINQLFEVSCYSFFLIQIWGSLTAFYGGLCAVFQSDIKRLLAYSTISHCGFLMVCVSTEILETTVLYLYIHGFFKATSFLCVGNIIRVSLNYQDFRRMGQFFKYLPFEFFTLFVCALNLGGFPLTIGFFSKHFLFVSLNLSTIFTWIVFINCFFGALCGFIYCFRLLHNVFFDFKKARKGVYLHLCKLYYKSLFYSNSALLSMFAITNLLFNSYLICGSLLILYWNFFFNIKSCSEFFFSNVNLLLLIFENHGFLKNFKIFNFIALIFFFSLFSFKYKLFFFSSKNLNITIFYFIWIGIFIFFCFSF